MLPNGPCGSGEINMNGVQHVHLRARSQIALLLGSGLNNLTNEELENELINDLLVLPSANFPFGAKYS